MIRVVACADCAWCLLADLLGVALGTAALEIAKAGLNIDPQFWVLDLIAIVIGCLIGCFMPVCAKHQRLIGGRGNNTSVAIFAWANIIGLFVAVLLAGVPYEGFHIASLVIVSIIIILLILMLTLAGCSGNSSLKIVEANLL